MKACPMACADDEHAVAFGNLAPMCCVASDREKFDHRRLVERDALGPENIARRDGKDFAHAAIAMHAEHADIHAAIWLAALAGMADAAGDIGVDVDLIPGREMGVSGCLQDFAREFMAHDARIVEIRVLALEDMQIGAADADAADSDQHLAIL